MLITLSAMYFIYQSRVFDLQINWYVGILAFAAYDFMPYLIHLLSHKIRFFWCRHIVHHSAKEMKTSLTFRDSFAQFSLSPHEVIRTPLLGFHPILLVIVQSFEQLYAVPLHFSEKLFSKSNTNTTWINKIFITRTIHRAHHSKEDIYLDENYGITFSIWGHVFKTYQKEEADVKPIFGLTKNR
jgi:sterol desaturase/sphingolipid hydroxylase (fatty acid hydroxylase superfamily)